MISKERLAEQLARMGAITSSERGITRLAFTDADWEGRAYLRSLMEAAGLTVREDAFGNLIGRREGTHPDLPPVLCGSHGDSVPEGGNYDGVCGILSAIELARSMEEEHFANERPYEVMLFMCEESSRFGAATLGSRAMCGELTEEDLHRYRDKDGHALWDVLKARGLAPERIAAAQYEGRPAAYFELHIEQGRVLEHEGKPIGVVTGIAAPARCRLHIAGQADHSGATPMDLRHDGLAMAAEIILAVEAEGKRHRDPPVVATASTIEVKPNALNVVPGEVVLGLDLRSISAEARKEAEEQILADVRAISRRRHIPYAVEDLGREDPVPLRQDVVEFLLACTKAEGLSAMALPSGAGHDAMHWGRICPTGMLFIPCRGGVSHRAEEYAELADIANGARVLERAVRAVLQREVSLGGEP